jgi:hypothetical protein
MSLKKLHLMSNVNAFLKILGVHGSENLRNPMERETQSSRDPSMWLGGVKSGHN